ncbi:UPF0619 GPI-anchored membrane protein [Vanrija pseudolonga]|uniref:UPF0619 GPI-anchored membrane protein n=1 Tax=Vanrija pseudolonga TaxID=143232 RepID=A0AAF0Y5B2_9TREE|nr:UPF0619 GPI-anchored membrane protein [Vanrija pseudolonga]
MLFNAAYLLLAAAAARAIQITAPTNTSNWSTGVPQTIQWTSVSTDPSTFSIQIQVPSSSSLQTESVATNVQTSAGSYSYTPAASYVGSQYRINFVNSQTNAILAQSDYFTIAQGSAVASSSASASASVSASVSASSALVPSGSVLPSGEASASGPAIPNASASSKPNGAGALVPSLALVGGSLIALLA